MFLYQGMQYFASPRSAATLLQSYQSRGARSGRLCKRNDITTLSRYPNKNIAAALDRSDRVHPCIHREQTKKNSSFHLLGHAAIMTGNQVPPLEAIAA